MNDQKNSLLEGTLWKQIILFALPIAATSILQQLFNSTDTAVVGRFASSQALAAVGSTAAIVNLCVTIFTGLSIGANVLIAHAFGAGDADRVKQGVDTALTLSVISGLLLMSLGELITVPLLEWMGTPADIIADAANYLRVYFLGTPFLMIFNFEAAILRASGDAKRPLYCLMLSGVVNLGFNLLFVIVFKLGVVGVALGTLIADIFSTALLFYFLVHNLTAVKLSFNNFKPDGHLCGKILAIGIPAMFHGMMYTLANIVIQTGFNSLGSDVVASCTISVTAEIFVTYMNGGFCQAAVTFNGQNLGAGNIKRCRQATRWCLFIGGIFAEAFALLLFFFAPEFSRFFTTDAIILELAMFRMHAVLPFEIFNSISDVASGALRGLGYSTLPALLSALFICGTRLVWVKFIFPHFNTFENLITVYPVSWGLAGITILLLYIIVTKRTSS